MRILVDTNVIVDYIADRKPYSEESFRIMELCVEKEIECAIAAHTVSDLFFILRKDLIVEQRRDMLQKLCKIFVVVGIDVFKLEAALQNENFDDFEDCLQMECAIDFSADFIVTRNVKDFKHSLICVLEPTDFLKTSCNGTTKHRQQNYLYVPIMRRGKIIRKEKGNTTKKPFD